MQNEANLNAESFGKSDNIELESYRILKYIRTQLDKIDFYIVHLGILEKILGTEFGKSKEAMEALIKVFTPKRKEKTNHNFKSRRCIKPAI